MFCIVTSFFEKAYLFSSSIVLWYALQSIFVLCSKHFNFSFQLCSQLWVKYWQLSWRNSTKKIPIKAAALIYTADLYLPLIFVAIPSHAGNVSHWFALTSHWLWCAYPIHNTNYSLVSSSNTRRISLYTNKESNCWQRGWSVWKYHHIPAFPQ